MREIKFRQRNRNNGQFHFWGLVDAEWVNPLQQDNHVLPEESDQYIGFKDKNGKEMYEGDVIKWEDEIPETCTHLLVGVFGKESRCPDCRASDRAGYVRAGCKTIEYTESGYGNLCGFILPRPSQYIEIK